MRGLLRRFRDRLPPAEWLDGYGREEARGDLIAGLTVGVMLVPQGMAYAVIAGVPPMYGLYASVVPLLVYPLLGSSRHMAVGVNASVMVVVAAGLAPLARSGTGEYVELALLLAVMAGCIHLGLGLVRMGFLSNLLSRPVIVGFSTAAALIIALSQAGNLLGIELSRSQHVHRLVAESVGSLPGIHPLTAAIGAGCLAVLLALRRWAPLVPAELAVLAVATLASRVLDWGGAGGVELVAPVPSGLPVPGLPALSVERLDSLWPAALTLALVQFMGAVSLARLFSSRHRYTIEPDRELLALGAANLLGGLFRGIPVAGSFSRSAVNERAGAKTPLANVPAALLVLVTLLFFTPLFRFLPMPALASIVIMAAVNLLEPAEWKALFRAKPGDGWIAVFTVASVLMVGILEGILLGVGAAVLAVLYRLSRPYVAELGHLPSTRAFRNVERFAESEPVEGILVLRVEAGFSFFNARFFRDFVLERTREDGGHRAVVIDGKAINYMDSTALEALREVAGTLREWGVEIHFAELTGPVRDVLERSGLGEEMGYDCFHMAPHDAVVHILERWDREDGTDRLERYRRAAEMDRDRVRPGSGAPLT